MHVCRQKYPHTCLSLTLPWNQALLNTAEACTNCSCICANTNQFVFCFCVSRYRPRTYCLADSDEESSSAGSSDEEDSSELSNDSTGAEGWGWVHMHFIAQSIYCIFVMEYLKWSAYLITEAKCLDKRSLINWIRPSDRDGFKVQIKHKIEIFFFYLTKDVAICGIDMARDFNDK